MIDYILTAIIPLVLAVCVLWGNKKADTQDCFMSKDYTTVLKGVCCIIVILVHIPESFQNKLQDGIGSFAYVCVTIFFLISAYGMSLSKERKQNYMRHFWQNRLMALLIPQLLVNACHCVYGLLTHSGGGWIIHIDNYVVVLLEYCVWFYLVYLGRKFYSVMVSNILLVIGVVISSVVMYFLFDKAAWCYERWGLVWGLFIYLNLPLVKKWVNPNLIKVFAFGLIALVLGVAYLKFKPVFFWGEYLLKIVLGIAIITFVFVLSSKRQLGNKAINFLGGISYEVYLSHGFIMAIIAHLFPTISSGIFILSTVLMTIIFSTFINAIGKPLVRLCRHK